MDDSFTLYATIMIAVVVLIVAVMLIVPWDGFVSSDITEEEYDSGVRGYAIENAREVVQNSVPDPAGGRGPREGHGAASGDPGAPRQ